MVLSQVFSSLVGPRHKMPRIVDQAESYNQQISDGAKLISRCIRGIEFEYDGDNVFVANMDYYDVVTKLPDPVKVELREKLWGLIGSGDRYGHPFFELSKETITLLNLRMVK